MIANSKTSKDEIKIRQQVKAIKKKAADLGIPLTTRENRAQVFKLFDKGHHSSLAKIRIMQEFPEPKPIYVKRSFYSQHGLRPMPWIRRFMQWSRNTTDWIYRYLQNLGHAQ